jgi:hypothetical protein
MALAGVVLFLFVGLIPEYYVLFLSVGLFLVFVGLAVGIAGARAKSPRVPPIATRADPLSVSERAQTPATREIYKEREIIREIVKIRCRHCRTLFEEKLDHCPHCGAPP